MYWINTNVNKLKWSIYKLQLKYMRCQPLLFGTLKKVILLNTLRCHLCVILNVDALNYFGCIQSSINTLRWHHCHLCVILNVDALNYFGCIQRIIIGLFEWVSNCCLNSKWAIFRLYHGENISYNRWHDDDDVHFVLDQHA